MEPNYGERLAIALQMAEKDRQQLADGINISVQAIGQVIAGKTKALTAENSAKAARYLGVDGFWLATGIGKPQPVTEALQHVGLVAEPHIDQHATTDEIIELIALYQQASKRGRENILDLARSAVKQSALRWKRTAN